MRVLVVDDAPDIAALLTLAFQRDGYAVDSASSGADALELTAIHAYDVLILDRTLPDGDGVHVCRSLRTAHPSLLILILTMRTETADIIVGLDAGADDYVTKPFDYDELVARVRALLRRDMRARAPHLTCGDLTLDPSTAMVWQAGQRRILPRKPFRILEYLLRHQGDIVSQEELLEHVWNAEANPFTNTVRVHINALRRALGDTASAPRYIETVVGVGYRLAAFAAPPSLTETLCVPVYAASDVAAEAPERTRMEPHVWNDPPATAPTLLIVDDAPDITQLLVVYLHQAGFHTLTAYTGRAALALVQHHTPDLIILDLGLPDMDGLEVCRAIRATHTTPIVLLTKRNTAADRASGLAAGANAYVTKPFDADDLQTVVRSLLPAPVQP